MPLTIDRPDVTAAQLNSLWASLISKIAGTLPVSVRDPNGDGSVLFDDLDIDESDTEASAVLDPIDLVDALRSKASGIGGASWITTTLEGDDGRRLEAREPYIAAALTLTSIVVARSVLPPAFSSTDVLINGAAGLTITASRVISDAAGGWGLAAVIGDVETFDGLGIEQWGAGDVGQIAEVEGFDGVGIGAWSSGGVFQVGEVEHAWSGWPAGTDPPTPSGADCMDQSDLTSQVDGQRTSFTAPTYEAGSLRVYLNGQRLSGSMVTETSSTTFTISEIVPEVGDSLVIDYCSC